MPLQVFEEVQLEEKLPKMIPGLPPLPHQFPNHAMLPLLQQAWLSRANTSVANSFIQSQLNLGQPPQFSFPHPFLPAAPTASSPVDHQDTLKRLEEAEDLSLAKRTKREEAVCPICSITMRWEELPDHFQTELRCLENIRSLSPITRPASSTSSRPFSSSPNKSLSISPSSPAGHLENRWQRFERIRTKRRERIGAKVSRQQSESGVEKETGEVDIDIGDSVSDCGSGAGSDGEQSSSGQQLHNAYTEADVLRAQNMEIEETVDEAPCSSITCPSCSSKMNPPVLNISCWHLKCERCWLKAVGTEKGCSTCNSPVSVKDLRRVQL